MPQRSQREKPRRHPTIVHALYSDSGTTDTTGSGCRSTEVVTEGLEGSAPGPHRSLIAAFSLRDARPIAYAAEAVDAGAPMDAQTASTAAWKSRPEREIPTAPTAIIVLLNRDDDHVLRRGRSRFTRF